MILYDEAVLERYSTDYVETLIADELPTSNEAAENSLIDLQFNLVHTGKVRLMASRGYIPSVST